MEDLIIAKAWPSATIHHEIHELNFYGCVVHLKIFFMVLKQNMFVFSYIFSL